MIKKHIRTNIKCLLLGLVVCGMLVSLSACKQNSQDVSIDQSQNIKTVKIAKQYGLAYAPITVMQELNFIHEEDPNLHVEWVQLGNTAAIREAILTDELDIGFMGIPPYLIGVENGMNWQIFTGLSKAPLGLMSNDTSINSLKDINPSHKIALPQPGSIQHILLSMAAKREMGDPKAFDNQLVSLKHPDGVQMLLAGSEVTMHFTSPPFVFQEEEQGMQRVISGEEAFGGPFTFIVGTLREEILSDTQTVSSVNNALKRAIEYMNKNPEETVTLLSEVYGIEKSLLKTYLYDSGLEYSQKVEGLETFVDFMVEAKYLTHSIKEDTLLWSVEE